MIVNDLAPLLRRLVLSQTRLCAESLNRSTYRRPHVPHETAAHCLQLTQHFIPLTVRIIAAITNIGH